MNYKQKSTLMKSILVIFLKSTFAFILLFSCYVLLILEFEEKIVIKLISNSIIFSSAFTLTHVLLSKNVGVENDYSVYQKSIIKNEVKVDDFTEKISKLTNWKLVKKTEYKLVYRSTFNSVKSFGETVTISLNNGETVVISKPIVITTLFDFGKNYENIKLVKSII